MPASRGYSAPRRTVKRDWEVTPFPSAYGRTPPALISPYLRRRRLTRSSSGYKRNSDTGLHSGSVGAFLDGIREGDPDTADQSA